MQIKVSIVVKKSYCDWDRYKEYKRDMHEAAFEMIEIPHLRQSGKNSADIRMLVDALHLCYTKMHIDTFVIISGDSVLSPLMKECYASIECRVTDTRMVNAYNMFILEAVKAWLDPAPKNPRTLHHLGKGAFMIAGETVKLSSIMK